MFTLNQRGSSGSDSKLNPLAGRSLKTIISIFIVLIIVLVAAVLLLKQKSVQPETGQKVQKIVIPEVFYNLAGMVKKIEENSFILEASIPKLDESGRPIQKKEDRKVNITSATRFSRLSFVAQEGKVGKVPVESLITFKEIKEGDYIEVISSQDVSKAKEFEASQVRSLSR